jgi:hypothetical protein
MVVALVALLLVVAVVVAAVFHKAHSPYLLSQPRRMQLLLADQVFQLVWDQSSAQHRGLLVRLVTAEPEAMVA